MNAFEQYCEREGIDQEIARDAAVYFEKYVYDYSVSHGPNLNVNALHCLIERLLNDLDKQVAANAALVQALEEIAARTSLTNCVPVHVIARDALNALAGEGEAPK